MSFFRPEARAVVWRWREVLVALVVLILAARWTFWTGGILHWVGFILLGIGGILLFSAVQRLRFRSGQSGPGVVNVDEGEVSYFGPLTGGAVSIREITRLELDPTLRPAHWRLHQPGQGELLIPLTATGAEALFDAFATLPGIQTEKMLAEMKRGADHPVVIWQKTIPRLH